MAAYTTGQSGHALGEIVMANTIGQRNTLIGTGMLLCVTPQVMLAGSLHSGRRSVARLAAFICGFEVVELSPTTSDEKWNKTLRSVVRRAGLGFKPLVVLASDVSSLPLARVVMLSSLATDGMVAELFTAKDMASSTLILNVAVTHRSMASGTFYLTDYGQHRRPSGPERCTPG